MSDLEIPLSSIRAAFQGVIPTPIATASPDGTPNSSYLSIVWFVDDERIAVSNQFMRKTAANLADNGHAVLRLVDPTTMTEYEVEATHLRTESSGDVFERVRTQLEAIAAHSGQADVFRLRSIELLRVDRCAPASRAHQIGTPGRQNADVLSSLDTFVRRIGESRDLAQTTRVALESLEDLFGYERSMLFLAAPEENQLFVVAANGHRGAVGAEVSVGDGVIGVAAHRHRQIRVGEVDRLSRAASEASIELNAPPEVPATGLPDARSMLVTPLLLHDRLVGVLYLDSQRAGRFDADDERLIDVLAAHLAMSIALHDSDGFEPVISPAVTPPDALDDEVTVAFYDHDGTVLVDGAYVIKGVPGRILCALLSTYIESGRTEFTNRELRLDRSIDLPHGKDNLEARLLTLRRRLDERGDAFRLERVGRGQLLLTVNQPVRLERHDR